MRGDWLFILVAGLVIILPGCATTAPTVPALVRVPVPTPCLTPADLPARPPILADRELARLDDYDLVRTIAAERADLVAWSAEAQALLERCTRD